MKFISSVCILLFLNYGISAYSLKSSSDRTEYVTIIFGPDVPHLFTNTTEDKEIVAASEVGKLKSLTTEEAKLKSLTTEEAKLKSLATEEVVDFEAPPSPPPPDDAARMARFIVHYSLWGSLSHISHQPHVSGSPLARVYSISDGPFRNSSGVPYFYLTPNDPELRDMFFDPRASLTLTLAQSPYCRVKSYDPEDPRCAQVILTGRLIVLKNSTAEWRKAQQALFSRHPVMRNWPESHHWICCKLQIDRILVADNFGGNKYPSVDQYFRAHPNLCSDDNPMLSVAFY